MLSIFIIVLCPIILTGCKNNSETPKSKYELELNFDDENKTLYGKEKVKYTNNSENSFNYLYFHLYPNAFRENSKAKVVAKYNENEAYPNGVSYGEINIKNVMLVNEKCIYAIKGEDENILEVKLKQELFPNESVEIYIEFVVKLANIHHRLGYGDNTINFGNFYPILCVYENGKGFMSKLYNSNGDPFYSECADYIVSISYSKKFNIASSGNNITVKEEKDSCKADIVGKNIRDFCFVLSDKFVIEEENLNGIAVKYYGYRNDDNMKSCLEISVKAMEFFIEKFGEYPYKQISIVKSNFIHGGMEYPNIVLISDKYSKQEDLNFVIVHELAHQWWYGLVGNDEYNNAWMDEGLAEYSSLMFFRENKIYGHKFENLLNGSIESYKTFLKVYNEVQGGFVDTSMNRALDEFKTEPEYTQCIYNKGLLMFNSIENTVGKKKFIKALNKYVSEFRFKNAKPENLIYVFNKTTKSELTGIFNSWLTGKVVIK